MVGIGEKIAVSEPDRLIAMKGADLLCKAKALDRGGLYLATEKGEKTTVEFTAKLLDALRIVLTSLGENGGVVLVNEQSELSPEQAAKILGISRPLVYQRMDDDRLPFREVGSHRRVLASDVMALRAFERERRKAAQELAADTDDLEANHAPTPQGAA